MLWVKRVEAILAALKESNIAELELADGDLEILLRRRPGQFVAPPIYHHAESHDTVIQGSNQLTISINAPLTGVCYLAPSPGSPPFVAAGDHVQVGQTVALIEAMKVFNEIQAEVAGRVVAVMTQDGTVIKKGASLLQIEPA